MKKYIFIVVVLFLAFGLVSCSDDSSDSLQDDYYEFTGDGIWGTIPIDAVAEKFLLFEFVKGSPQVIMQQWDPIVNRPTYTCPYTYDKSVQMLVIDVSSTKYNVDSMMFYVSDSSQMVGVVLYHDTLREHSFGDVVCLNKISDTKSNDYYVEALDSNYIGYAKGPRSYLEELESLGDWNDIFENDNFAQSPENQTRVAGVTGTVLSFVGQNIAGAIIGRGVNEALSALFCSEPKDPNIPRFEKICKQLGEMKGQLSQIQQQLEKIDKKIDREIYLQLQSSMTGRNEMWNALNLSVSDALDKLVGAKTFADSTNIILNWGDSYVDGNRACDAWQLFIDNAITNNAKCYCDLYDEFVYCSTAWEKTGYGWRSALRSQDIALISTCATLSAAYYKICNAQGKNNISEQTLKIKIDKIVEKVDAMDKNYQQHVIKKTDKVVCQIHGMHFTIQNTPDEMIWVKANDGVGFPSWCKKNSVLAKNMAELLVKEPENVNNLCYGSDNVYYKQVMSTMLTKEHFTNIINFYQGTGKTVREMLTDGGIKLEVSGVPLKNLILPSTTEKERKFAINVDGNFKMSLPVVNLDAKDESTAFGGMQEVFEGKVKVLPLGLYKLRLKLVSLKDYHNHPARLRILSTDAK